MKYPILLILFATNLQAGETIYLSPRKVVEDAHVITQDNLPANAKSTPHKEVRRILKWFNLTPESTLVEYGCGYDARFCIAASSVYGCRSIGIEIDPERARSAKRLVLSLGLQDKVTIIEGDATVLNIEADYGVAYLWPDTLAHLRQKILDLKAFASYSHNVPGLPLVKSGESYFYNQRTYKQVEEHEFQAIAHWNGVGYTGRACSNPNCEMCNSIQQQIEQSKRSLSILSVPIITLKKETAVQATQQQQTHTDKTFKVECTRKYCIYETWRTFSDGSKVRLDRWRVDN